MAFERVTFLTQTDRCLKTVLEVLIYTTRWVLFNTFTARTKEIQLHWLENQFNHGCKLQSTNHTNAHTVVVILFVPRFV